MKHTEQDIPLTLAARAGCDELENAADELLRASGALGNGLYTQRQLDRKIANERKRLECRDEAGMPDDVLNHIIERQTAGLIEASRLTVIQEIVFRLHISGLTCRHMAATLHARHQTVAVHLRAAKRRVRAAYNEGSYAGWFEVYLSEVRRGKRD